MINFSKPVRTIKSGDVFNQKIVDAFRESDIKIAVQKSGHISDISRKIIKNYLKIDIKEPEKNSRLIVTTNDYDGKTIGFYFAKNKSICNLVANQAVDIGIVGIDQLIEFDNEEDIEILKSYGDSCSWPLVLATPVSSKITDFKEVKTIATQYPKLVSRFLESIGRLDIKIVATLGSTEAMCYTQLKNKKIDAIIDICRSGNTMTQNSMNIWEPHVVSVYPVIVANKRFINNKDKFTLLNLNF